MTEDGIFQVAFKCVNYTPGSKFLGPTLLGFG